MADLVTMQDIYDLFKASQVEFDRRMERLEQLSANASREVSRLGDRWGLFVENMVAPAILRLFQERGRPLCLPPRAICHPSMWRLVRTGQ